MNPTDPIQINPSAQRWHALDALRGLALLLGVVLHATMSYLPGSQYWWIVNDQDQSITLGVAFHVIHMFRMLVFFLIAGFFARFALQRWGTRRFVVDRARRIAVPLLAGWAPIFAAIVAVVVWAAWLKGGGKLPTDSPPGPAFTPDDFPLTHLWFLYVLLLLYIAALLLRATTALLDRHDRFGAGSDWLLRYLLRPWADVSPVFTFEFPVAVAACTRLVV